MGQSSVPQGICAKDQGILESFGSSNVTTVYFNLRSVGHDSVHRQLPPVDWMKLNVDAAKDANRCVVGYSAAVRNHEGLVMVAGIAEGVFFDDVDVTEVEAL